MPTAQPRGILHRFPRTVDDVTVRVIAAEVLVLAVVALAVRQQWLYGVLALDFVLRSVIGPSVSPLACLAALGIRPRLQARPRPTAGPPKRFAAAIGAVLTTAAPVACYALGWDAVTWAIGAIMVVFPLLESAFGLCVGCLVFFALMRVGVIPTSVCEECADITRRLGSARRPPASEQVQVAQGVDLRA
jgi:stage V sporulation protein SpoVS